MNKLLFVLAAFLFMDGVLADSYVRGYVRRDGTYVPPHFRSSPNQNRFDNYSGRGNVNPYTGERGSERHEFTNPPEFNTGRSGGSSVPGYGMPSYGNPYSNPYRNPYLDND